MSVGLRGLESTWVRPRADWALQVATHYRVPVTVTSTLRTFNEQAELRRRYEAGQSQFPANRPGDSAHNYGLAWDSVVDPRAQAWWDYVRTLAGFHVPQNDRIHAEVPNWRQYVTT
jgi:hypothetical protein